MPRRHSVGGAGIGAGATCKEGRRICCPMRPSTMLLSCAIAGLAASAALAQATNYTSVEATAGKPVQLTYHASAHKSSCTPAPLPTVRGSPPPPKAGVLTIRKALLTTGKNFGLC